jgi:ABC-type Fe3+-hydroxamate transport system substrate-binding protein
MTGESQNGIMLLRMYFCEVQVIDQIGVTVNVTNKPNRIISLVPSQTELLYDLGLREEVVGITKFCVHPNNWFKSKDRIGGTKKLNLDKIRDLDPDLIIANKEENTQEEIETLQKEFPVWTSDIHNLDSAVEMIDQIGVMTNCIPKAQQLIHQIFEAQGNLERNNKRVLYLIWHDDMMGAGQGTFIDSMLNLAGFDNAIQETRYPMLSLKEVHNLNPDFIFLSSEPFPFKEKHKLEYQAKFPDAHVVLVDGELFSWYGSRLLKSFDYFRKLNEELLII